MERCGMTLAERKQAEARVRKFKLEYPGFMDSMPAVIIGARNQEVCLLDAT